MEAFIQLGFFITLLAIGYIFGRRAEVKHYRSIASREQTLGHIVVTTERLPAVEYMRYSSGMVCGNVVISIDYFKLIAASLRSLLGGRIAAYESLLDRGRREAILRMQQEAAEVGAELVINLKFETSRISGNASRGIGSIEVLAYGTALVPPR